jgi:uncharacterized membrane protein YkvA (DUF1232 family)
MRALIEHWKTWARQLKIEVYALYLAYRDPRTPWYARVVAACVVGYAFSPIDLIPDFIPIIGYLDDLLLVPLGVLLARRLIPAQVLAESRAQAQAIIRQGKPVNWLAAALIIAVWLAVVGLVLAWVVSWVRT